MNAKKANSTSYFKKTGPDKGEELPSDINLEDRKNIIRDALNNILGNTRKKKVEEFRRIKNKWFQTKKNKDRVAKASKRRNRK
jgi:3-methyladenine DNA glycosylase AlkC